MYSIQNLDNVLKSFERISQEPLSFDEIKSNLDFKISDQELDAAVLKLAKDGYLHSKEIFEKGKVIGHRYYLSFEGYIFLKQGCYAKEIKRINAKANLQSWQTWAIAIGTVLAGLYGLWETSKEIYTFFCSNH